jgi:hypothetical protein
VIPSGNLSFTKGTLVGLEWELNPEVLGSLLLMASGGEIILAESRHDLGRRAVSLLNYILAFALQLRKSTENLSQGSRCADLAVFLGTASAGLLNVSPPRLPVGDFSQPLVGTAAFHVAKERERFGRIAEE